MEPVNLAPEVGCQRFEAAGQTYTRTEGLSLGRAILLQRFQTELQFNMYVPHVQEMLTGAVADFNGLKFAEGSAKLLKLMDGADVIGNNRLREADTCALFYNTPDEDPASDDYAAVVKNKVAAWRAAGVDATFFTAAAWWLLMTFQQRSQQALEGAQALLQKVDLPTN